MNIIADIAGRYDELMLLLAKMPQNEPILLVGDLVDRGPKSNLVITWAMSTPNVITLMGNHEHMMIDYLRKKGEYESGTWKSNGGNYTLQSYVDDGEVPESHIKWLENLPRFYKEDGLYVSHAPCRHGLQLGERSEETDFLWERYPPLPVEGVFQIFGHNSSMRSFLKYAICIDDCGMKRLTGYHWPSKQIYQQEYL